MKLAGYPSGTYTGSEAITVVGSKGNPSEQDAEIVNQTLRGLGLGKIGFGRWRIAHR